MIDWFRHRHGLSTDPKLAFVAKLCGVHRSFAITAWSYLLERASSAEDRGSIAGIDRDEMAFSLDFEREIVDRLMIEFDRRGLVRESRIAKWNDHHPNPGTSTERVRMHRERKAVGEAQLPENKAVAPETFPPDDETKRNVPETNETQYAREELDLESELEIEGEGAGEGAAEPVPAAPVARRTGKRCPRIDDLTLDDELRDRAAKHNRDAAYELDRFRNHVAAKGVRFKDYRAGFRNWLSSPYGKPQPTLPGIARPNGHAPPDARKFARAKARDRLKADGLSEFDPTFDQRLTQLTDEILTDAGNDPRSAAA